MARLAILIVLATVIGCSDPQNKTHEILGTTAERVAGVTRVIESNAELPSDIFDARLIEVQLGDGQLGPSDFRSFVWIKVSADDVAKWQSALERPLGDFSPYETPPSKPSWWLAKNSYDKLTKYNSYALFNRPGWIVVQDDGNIFAVTFTQ